MVAIPLAAPESFGPLPEGCSLEEERRAHGLPAKYFLCLGTLEPRQHLRRIFQAFAAIAREDQESG